MTARIRGMWFSELQTRVTTTQLWINLLECVWVWERGRERPSAKMNMEGLKVVKWIPCFFTGHDWRVWISMCVWKWERYRGEILAVFEIICFEAFKSRPPCCLMIGCKWWFSNERQRWGGNESLLSVWCTCSQLTFFSSHCLLLFLKNNF